MCKYTYGEIGLQVCVVLSRVDSMSILEGYTIFDF